MSRSEKISVFAAYVRKCRQRKGMTLKQAAQACRYSYSTIARLEHGVIGPTDENIKRIALAFELTEEERRYLHTLGKQHRRISQGEEVEKGKIGLWQEIIGEQEQVVDTLREFNLILVNGLLQTPEYMTALFYTFLKDDKQVAIAVRGRLERQQVLKDSNKEFRIVLHEGALRFRFTSNDIHLRQLKSLLPIFELPNVDLRILPYSKRLNFLPPHDIYIAGSRLVSIETLSHEVQIINEAGVETHISAFEELRRRALVGEEAASYLSRIIDDEKARGRFQIDKEPLSNWDRDKQWKGYAHTIDVELSDDER